MTEGEREGGMGGQIKGEDGGLGSLRACLFYFKPCVICSLIPFDITLYSCTFSAIE